MKILFVVWNYYPNTAYTNHTKATVRGMRECGCYVDVLSIKPLIQDDSDCIKGQRRSSKAVLPTVIGMLADYILLKESVRKYDIVYCATSDMRVIQILLNKVRKYGLPIVHERTEMPDIFYKNTTKEQRALKAYLKKVSEFDKVFTISNPIRDYFIENGVLADKIHIYPMIVDPHRFDNKEKRDVGYRFFAYCGNLSNSKDGVADLIEAYGCSRAKSSHKLMLIGSKPSEGEQQVYENLIKRYAIEDKVIFRGEVSREEMPQVLMDADVLLLCRPNNRQALGGFPTKLGEYLSTGNPVLVTRVGDIGNYIVDGENGYLAEPGNVVDFSEKLDAIIDDYGTACEVGNRGRELAFNVFNYSVQTKKIVEIIKSLL
jgi:glycosyltransferase involved in cell wall biosynthesis